MSRAATIRIIGLLALVFLAASCSKPSQAPESKGAESAASEKGDAHEHAEDPGHTEPEHSEAAHSEGGHSEAGHPEAGHSEAGHSEAEPEEGHVKLSRESQIASGIEVQVAGARRLRVTLDLPGEVVPNADRLAHIVPRFPGIVREVKKGLGQQVHAGEELAVIEGNQSLSTYVVNSLISGTVIEKHVTLGEFVRDDQDIYVVADLSSVWVNVAVYARDVAQVRRGQTVFVESVGVGPSTRGVIDYVGAVVGEATRAATARVAIPNRELRWRPGMFVTARVVVNEREVSVAVPDGSVQRVEERDCVFIADADGFEARAVKLGRTDGEWIEILSGLKSGERYVSRASFVLKSELQKSEAGHGH
ncbi:MAG: HlyD family efflux transporter periplasmic adaptor subunit [Candidatus Eisenbacteria bacterium]|uniref:HlyD family efflux transporter periplasmic adaptor subunit n=1 Tax=Eiseniibacteriota bacterium TaxID=2212470 RepID=A0A849SE87_UNCEI|nr:HlyD family efflux transporter periplasmic adaptor subunit [Candidatus Eisenbacteria bacterium]